MEIKMKTKEVSYHTVSHFEWDRVVNEFYKPTPEWDFVSDEEANNDSSYTFNVDGEVNEYEERKLEKFKKDSLSQSRMTHTLLADLCRKGLIPKGVYLIKVSW